MRDWLKESRSEKGLTMAQMASRLNISESYYSLIEAGDRQKKMDMVIANKLSVILGVPIKKIVELESERSK